MPIIPIKHEAVAEVRELRKSGFQTGTRQGTFIGMTFQDAG
jgi:hypothetical protein